MSAFRSDMTEWGMNGPRGELQADMTNAEEQQEVERPPIVYVHIPKTGGTTVHNALLRAYGAENVLHAGKPEETQALREMPREDLRSFDVISAHMSQPELENRVGPGAAYITAVRQPVERFLSLYSFLKESDWHYLHKDVAHLDLPSFIDWVQDEPNFLMLDHQSYYFCKAKDGKRAIEALEKNFVNVGRTEELWDFLIDFFESQGIDSVETRSLNKTKKRLQKTEVSPAHLKKIAELYEADCLLYDHVLKKCGSAA